MLPESLSLAGSCHPRKFPVLVHMRLAREKVDKEDKLKDSSLSEVARSLISLSLSKSVCKERERERERKEGRVRW